MPITLVGMTLWEGIRDSILIGWMLQLGPRYPAPQLQQLLHSATATRTPTQQTAQLSLQHYRPPCGIGKTGLAVSQNMPDAPRLHSPTLL